ncbi:hypothetical protein MWE_1448 [Helicobacter pylori XZ274]|nr:hypothetical protein MWE_1448 [Helicobacter pylori XZ274]
MGMLFQNTSLRVLQPNLKRSHQVKKPPFLSLLNPILNPF